MFFLLLYGLKGIDLKPQHLYIAFLDHCSLGGPAGLGARGQERPQTALVLAPSRALRGGLKQ